MVAANATHRFVKFLEREFVIERSEDLLDKTVADAKLDELAAEEILLVLRVRDGLGRRDETRRLVELDRIVGVDDAAAERDRRNVAFADGSQTEDEPLRTPSCPGLILSLISPSRSRPRD